MNRLLIAAPSSGTGKTSVALGLMRVLRDMQLKVQPFKAGPDYIDTAFHTQACGVRSRNLDLWMLDPGILKALFVRSAATADINIIEGVMGLYDGLDHSMDNGSSAHLSRLLGAPVILVLDGSGIAASAAAMVKGFRDLDPRVNLAGVLVNKVSGEAHYRLIRDAVEALTGVPCFGYVVKDPAVALESRHLGLVPSVETENLEDKLERLARGMKETVDVEGLLALSRQTPAIEGAAKLAFSPVAAVRIALAQDEAFNFYYADNLDILRDLGVEWVPFSPVHDAALPEGVSGLYIGGGFPEVFGEQLSANLPMRSAVKRAAEGGMPIYAECGGFMYLMDALRDFGKRLYPMTGVLGGTAHMTKRLQRFGYVTVETLEASLFGPAGTTLRGHEFHRSARLGSEEGCRAAYRVTKARPPHDGWTCGENTGSILAAYAHIHWGSNLQAAEHFVKACAGYAEVSKLNR